MMYIILPLIIIIFILIIFAIIKTFSISIKENKKETNNVVIISFLFPFVGLIIYVVNIGKDEKLAKKGLKYSLYGIGLYFVVLLLTLILMFLLNISTSSKNVTIHSQRNDTIEVDNTNNDLSKEEKEFILEQGKECFEKTKLVLDYKENNSIDILTLEAFDLITKEQRQKYMNLKIHLEVEVDDTNQLLDIKIVYE